MSEPQRIKTKDRDFVVIDEPLEWKEKDADFQWFKDLLASGDYEDGCPLIRVHNLDEWDGEDPHFELCVEFTRNPLNLFAQYLIKKYEFEIGVHFWRQFCVEQGIFDDREYPGDVLLKRGN